MFFNHANGIKSTIGVDFFSMYTINYLIVFFFLHFCRSTYAKTTRDSRRAREREFLQAVCKPNFAFCRYIWFCRFSCIYYFNCCVDCVFASFYFSSSTIPSSIQEVNFHQMTHLCFISDTLDHKIFILTVLYSYSVNLHIIQFLEEVGRGGPYLFSLKHIHRICLHYLTFIP